jgi:hypothetical protein
MLMAKAPRSLSGKRLAGCVASGLVVLFIGVCVLPVLRWLLVIELFRPPGCRMRVWVKVLDQGGTPVSGYQFSVGGWKAKLLPIGEAHSIGYWITTDQEGMAFFDSGRRVTRMFFGENFEGEALKNPSYLGSLEGVTLSCADLAGTGEQSNSPRWGGLGKDKDHPLLVHVWRHGPPRRLLRWDHHEDGLRPGEQYVSVDFFKGTMWLSARPVGDVAWRKLSGVNEAEFIAGAGAGIQPILDYYAVEPPKDGYRQSLHYPQDWSNNLGRGSVYFYCRNRAYYGYMHAGGTHCFALINLDGERNLYYRGYPETDAYNMRDCISPPIEAPAAPVASTRGSRQQ